MSSVLPADKVLVQRATTLHSAPADMSTVQDTDLLLVNRAGVDYKCSVADWKASQSKPPAITSVTLADSPEAGRFTSGTFRSTVVADDGKPAASKGIKAWVQGTLKASLTSSNAITAVSAGSAGTLNAHHYQTAGTGGAIKDVVYGKITQDLYKTNVNYPMFQWAAGLNIGGHTDWYVPAKWEAECIYFNLKPGPEPANADDNLYAVPQRTSPVAAAQTAATLFVNGGSQAFDYARPYWTASEGATATSAWQINFENGRLNDAVKLGALAYARVIRRVPVAEYTAAGSPALGSYFAGGFFGGLYSTAGNGVADYALIVSPLQGGAFGATGVVAPSLTIAGCQTDGFKAGDAITPPGGSPVIGIESLTDAAVSVYDTTGFKVGDKIHGLPKTVANTKLYCKLNAGLTVTDLQSADPGYTAVTGAGPYAVTFPAALPTGAAPDTDLPAGTTITTELQAVNSSGTVTKTSNTVTPT